ncbi:MAG: aldehyde dehydrogenase family protein, partial [Rhodoferax sp.]|nr:aldehyde dehydrogenase family protein [Rhodoferax sp.]
MNAKLPFGVTPPTYIGGSKQLLIGGKWVPALSDETIPTINPATGEVIAHLARGGKADIDRAVAAARKAFNGEWSRWKPHDRHRLLVRVADL